MNRYPWLPGMGLIVLTTALLFGLGVGMRRHVVEAQYHQAGEQTLPFTLESALQFRRIKLCFDGQAIPAVDTAVGYPEGVNVRATYTYGSEPVYAALAHLFPRGLPLQERVRWIEVAVFCLAIPLVGWWVYARWDSMLAAVLAASAYAVSVASVVRSTGLELSRENVALPLLVAHLALLSRAERRRSLPAALASAVTLALALASWDLVQFYILLWMVHAGWSLVRHGSLGGAGTWRSWLLHVAALAIVGTWNPYLRAHGFLLSPAMLLAYGLLLLTAWRVVLPGRGSAGGWRRAWEVGLVLLPLIAALLLPNTFGAHYGHFGDLLAAKLRFLNQKPGEPALLTFGQRIMWVPALHSATWEITRRLFPAILWLTIPAAGVLLWRPEDRDAFGLTQLVFFFAASLLAYVLFVRLHVFVALFAAGVIGAWVARIREQGWLRLAAGVGLVVLVLVGEAEGTLRGAAAWGRPGVAYQELEELTDWFEALDEKEPVLANFGVSASILAYGSCPIVLHPKFESEEIRERVRAYGEALFKSDEMAFRDWAEPYGAVYYVYALGEFASRSPERQMRYFVDALDPPADAAARLFEKRPEEGEYFQYLWGNRKYRVFRILRKHDQAVAATVAAEARRLFEQGNLQRARLKAEVALAISPRQPEALRVLAHAERLMESGFASQEEHAE